MRKTLLSAIIAAPLLASAGGFQLNVQGAKAVGMGGAFTGVGTDASSVFYNPGAMTKLQGHNFNVGINFITPFVSLQTPETVNIDQTSGIGTPFHFYYTGSILKEKLEDKLKVGFLVNNQFGSSSSFEDDWQGRNIIQNISLKTFMFQPTVAYKLHDKLSIGAGFVFTTGSFSLEKAVPVGSSSIPDGKAHLEGSGTSMGYNVGVYSQFLTLGEQDGNRTEFAIGLDYRSQLALDLEGGEATFTNIPSSLIGKFPASTKFDSKMVLPSVATAGLSVKHIMTDKWSLEFAYDFNLTGWSSYDSLNFDFENADTPDSKSFQNWSNTTTHRLGLDFTYQNKLSLRAGLYVDKTPMPDGFVSPHLPGMDQVAYTAGIGYRMNDKFAIDFGYVRQDAEREASLDAANFSAKYHRIVNVYTIGVSINLGGSSNSAE
jgi:long-chain fatty acid transport protein